MKDWQIWLLAGIGGGLVAGLLGALVGIVAQWMGL